MKRGYITLKSDEREPDGYIVLSPNWTDLDYVARMDLLNDWRGVLDELTDQTRAAYRKRPHLIHTVCNDAIHGDKGLDNLGK